MLNFHAHGKLLLSGEYFVLDGALALAIPVNRGQQLEVGTNAKQDEGLFWRSLDINGQEWFNAHFSLDNFSLLHTSDRGMGQRLQSMFREIRKKNPLFLQDQSSVTATTRLEFPRQWGFGSSSTLIHLLGQWAKVDPFDLLKQTMGGSGYDIACAGAAGPLFYRLEEGKPIIRPAHFNPPFAGKLYFVYLGKKQNSREGIQRYRQLTSQVETVKTEISRLSEEMVKCTSLGAFKELLIRHEELVAASLQLPKAKSLYFSDFPGAVKSLGAWGGDFVLLASEKDFSTVKKYCEQRGLEVVLRYEDLIL